MDLNNLKDVNTSWDLKDYYLSVDDERIVSDISKIEELLDVFVSKYKGNIVSLSEEEIITFMDDENEFGDIISKIQLFMLYCSSLDTQNQEILKKEDELSHIFTKMSDKLTFVSQEFKERGYDDLMKLSESPILASWKNHFFQTAQSIKYILTEDTEKALNFKSSSGGKAGFSSLYGELTSSFMFKVKLPGEEEKVITDSEVRALRSSVDEDVRKESYRSIREVYNDKKIQITLGNCYSNVVKDCVSELNVRGFETVMDRKNIREELDNSVVNTLLSEVSNSYPMFQRYLKIKAKLLGKDKLKVWDVMAPLSKEETEYSFPDGLKLFLETAKEFDEEFYEFACDMFNERRVDVFPREGKRGGAFACYDKGFDSYVLLNWTNKIRDVSTLAHEIGHATHGHLSQVQKNEVYSTGMSLAETASVFNEMILSESLISKMNDSEKLAYLDEKLGDVFATIHRQIQYVLFERRCHEEIFAGNGLTYKDFNLMWREEQIRMSGDEIEFDVPAEEESSWSMIPHIFRTPFYCYSYSFGNLLTFALFEKYKSEGKPFVAKYKKLLAAGGSLPPAELLKTVGLDISKPEYYQNGLKVVSDMVDEFEELANSLK